VTPVCCPCCAGKSIAASTGTAIPNDRVTQCVYDGPSRLQQLVTTADKRSRQLRGDWRLLGQNGGRAAAASFEAAGPKAIIRCHQLIRFRGLTEIDRFLGCRSTIGVPVLRASVTLTAVFVKSERRAAFQTAIRMQGFRKFMDWNFAALARKRQCAAPPETLPPLEGEAAEIFRVVSAPVETRGSGRPLLPVRWI
jgi:hypothetical protein